MSAADRLTRHGVYVKTAKDFTIWFALRSVAGDHDDVAGAGVWRCRKGRIGVDHVGSNTARLVAVGKSPADGMIGGQRNQCHRDE